jgi:DNA-binding transcriptional ArsR family regulator
MQGSICLFKSDDFYFYTKTVSGKNEAFRPFGMFIMFLAEYSFLMEHDKQEGNTEKVLILPLSEDSRHITQTLSNGKALKILELLAQTPMSATSIADSLGLSLTTIKYNLDALMEADLIQVKDTRWSQKGREIKIYEPVQKMIVVTPGNNRPDRDSVLDMLKKYLALGAGAIFAAAGIESLYGFSVGSLNSQEIIEMDEATTEMAVVTNESNMSMIDSIAGGGNYNTTMVPPLEGMNEQAKTIAENATSIPMDKSVADSGTQYITELFSHASIWFLMGCLSILAILAVWEIYKRKKRIDGLK